MTDELRALVERLRNWHATDDARDSVPLTVQAADTLERLFARDAAWEQKVLQQARLDAKERDALRRELALAREDTARLDWLLEQTIRVGGPELVLADRAAIDAERAAGKEET